MAAKRKKRIQRNVRTARVMKCEVCNADLTARAQLVLWRDMRMHLYVYSVHLMPVRACDGGVFTPDVVSHEDTRLVWEIAELECTTCNILRATSLANGIFDGRRDERSRGEMMMWKVRKVLGAEPVTSEEKKWREYDESREHAKQTGRQIT